LSDAKLCLYGEHTKIWILADPVLLLSLDGRIQERVKGADTPSLWLSPTEGREDP